MGGLGYRRVGNWLLQLTLNQLIGWTATSRSIRTLRSNTDQLLRGPRSSWAPEYSGEGRKQTSSTQIIKVAQQPWLSELHFCKEEMVTAKLGQICCSGLIKITKAKPCCSKNYRTHKTAGDHVLHPWPS